MMYTGLSYYTTEAVLEGHPDKICDQIADAILDAFLQVDRQARVAVECLGTGACFTIAGEVFSREHIDMQSVAEVVYRDIGYTDELCTITRVNPQSYQLRRVVEDGAAGDQGVMYGFACNTDFNYLPYGVYAVNAIAREIDYLRKQTGRFLPDGKVQVSVKDGKLDTVVISVQHSENTDMCELKQLILDNAVARIAASNTISRLLFNHNSEFTAGGFRNDTGLTGRKLANDTYCGVVPHGGGSLSGKDPSKVDRCGTYMARFVAKNIVANELADWCLIAIAYVFGLAQPVMISLQTGDSIRDEQLLSLVKNEFDFRPSAIIERLGLGEVNYRQTATYGHFTNPTFAWEQVFQL